MITEKINSHLKEIETLLEDVKTNIRSLMSSNSLDEKKSEFISEQAKDLCKYFLHDYNKIIKTPKRLFNEKLKKASSTAIEIIPLILQFVKAEYCDRSVVVDYADCKFNSHYSNSENQKGRFDSIELKFVMTNFYDEKIDTHLLKRILVEYIHDKCPCSGLYDGGFHHNGMYSIDISSTSHKKRKTNLYINIHC